MTTFPTKNNREKRFLHRATYIALQQAHFATATALSGFATVVACIKEGRHNTVDGAATVALEVSTRRAAEAMYSIEYNAATLTAGFIELSRMNGKVAPLAMPPFRWGNLKCPSSYHEATAFQIFLAMEGLRDSIDALNPETQEWLASEDEQSDEDFEESERQYYSFLTKTLLDSASHSLNDWLANFADKIDAYQLQGMIQLEFNLAQRFIGKVEPPLALFENAGIWPGRGVAAKLNDAALARRPAIGPSTEITQGYLGLSVDEGLQIVASATGQVAFENRARAWKLFTLLRRAGERGLTREELFRRMWSDRAVTPNSLDQAKTVANKLLAPLRVEVANGDGVWRLVLMNLD